MVDACIPWHIKLKNTKPCTVAVHMTGGMIGPNRPLKLELPIGGFDVIHVNDVLLFPPSKTAFCSASVSYRDTQGSFPTSYRTPCCIVVAQTRDFAGHGDFVAAVTANQLQSSPLAPWLSSPESPHLMHSMLLKHAACPVPSRHLRPSAPGSHHAKNPTASSRSKATARHTDVFLHL